MNTRLSSWNPWFIGVALAACLVVPGCARERSPRLRHVVVISLDTTRADHLGCYGGRVATPHIDRVAAEGVRFDQALTPAPTTLAAHTSIMTGCYSHTHGVPRNGFSIDDANAMLAEVLAGAGYRTAAFLGSFALSSEFGFDAGFERFDENFDIHVSARVNDQEQRRAATVTDRVLEYLDEPEVGRDRPLFLFVHYFDPHTPYDPPAPYDTLYGGRRDVAHATFSFVSSVATRHRRHLGGDPEALPNKSGLTVELVHAADGRALRPEPELAALYAGEVSYVDEHVGRLIDGLRSRGILDDALLVITGDHGETFWEHADVWNHGLWVYDTTVRVPLIVRAPDGGRTARVVATPVSTIDVMPTVLEFAGVDAPARVEGVSLAPALRGEAFSRGPVFSEATQPWRKTSGGFPWPNATNPRCVRSGALKYIQTPYLGDLEELYDVATDPGERVDLLRWNRSRSLDARNALRAALDEWAQHADPLPVHSGTIESEKVRKRLESLGYIGEGDDEGTLEGE